MQHEWRCTNYYSTKNSKTGWFSVVILEVFFSSFFRRDWLPQKASEASTSLITAGKRSHRSTEGPENRAFFDFVCVFLLFLLVVVQMDLFFLFFNKTVRSFVEGVVILGCCFQWRCFVFFLGLWRPSYRIFIFIEAICTTNRPTNQPPHCGSCNFFRVPHHQHGSHCIKPSSQNGRTAMMTCPPCGSWSLVRIFDHRFDVPDSLESMPNVNSRVFLEIVMWGCWILQISYSLLYPFSTLEACQTATFRNYKELLHTNI